MVDSRWILTPAVALSIMIVASLMFLKPTVHHFWITVYRSLRAHPVSSDRSCPTNSTIEIQYNRTHPARGIWINSEGGMFERIESFNLALERISSDILRQTIHVKPNDTRNNSNYKRLIVFGASENFLDVIANQSGIETVFLSWSLNCPNAFIRDYYPLTGSDLFCSWIETPGMIANQLPYDVVYNRTCNRHHSIAVQPQPLDPLVVHAKYIRKGWFWPNNGKSFSSYIETDPPSYATYLHLINNGIVSTSGDVYTNDIQFIPYDVAPFPHERPKLPDNLTNIKTFNEVFVMTQWFGVRGSIYHLLIEDIPRLALYVGFLKRHPNITIASSEHSGERTKEVLQILGLDVKRLYNGWCRAKLVYLPRPASLYFPNIQEVQALSVYYREYINNNYPNYTRNKIILIKRTVRRTLSEQKQVEKAVKSAANHFNLSFALFRDDPTPSYNETMILFKSAVMVVAPHGAALSNLVFCDPGTFVVEAVCQAPAFILCFQRLAYILGLRWHGLPTTSGCPSVLNVAASSINDTVWRYLEMRRTSL